MLEGRGDGDGPRVAGGGGPVRPGEDAAATLRLADRHHCALLRALCMEYIASPGMLAAVMATEGFKELKVACPSLLIKILEKVGCCRSE